MNNIVDVIKKSTQRFRNNYAIIDGKEKVSYSNLFNTVEELSRELKNLGIGKYARVVLLCEDSIDYIIISLAILKIYAVVVPVPFGSVKEEIDNVLNTIKADFLISEGISSSKGKSAAILRNCWIKKDMSLLAIGRKKEPDVKFHKINPAFIRFTSGTTGKSKGVVLSHESIIARTQAANKALKVTSKDKIIWVLSMSFHFVVTILLFLRSGATIILSSRKFPGSLLESLKANKATFIYASPVHYNLMNSLPAFSRKMLSGVRMAVSTAVKLPPGIADSFYRKFGFRLSQAYGIIEVGLPFVNSSSDLAKALSVGKITAGYSARIKNKAADGTGNIYIKGKGMFDAYFSPWLMRKNVLARGWFDTGDIGRIDHDGFLFILGREKNVINFSGMKIFPGEVEVLINQYPKVDESLVYGIEHAHYGQIPTAKIVLKGCGQKDFDLEALRRFCYKNLASYKVPKDFEVVEALPKTASGKTKVFRS
jgi:long-chain acyl-CoA synthetase